MSLYLEKTSIYEISNDRELFSKFWVTMNTLFYILVSGYIVTSVY